MFHLCLMHSIYFLFHLYHHSEYLAMTLLIVNCHLFPNYITWKDDIGQALFRHSWIYKYNITKYTKTPFIAIQTRKSLKWYTSDHRLIKEIWGLKGSGKQGREFTTKCKSTWDWKENPVRARDISKNRMLSHMRHF